jgi:hypothetical protein
MTMILVTTSIWDDLPGVGTAPDRSNESEVGAALGDLVGDSAHGLGEGVG